MKILCVHGEGSSGPVFESQLASLRSRLEEIDAEHGHTMDFVDGPLASSPAPDVPSSAKPPYYAFYEGTDVKALRAAHEWLREVQRRDGPYDGVLSFSQGAELVSSYILYQQWYEPETAPPFKFAVFLSGGVPIAALKDLNVPISAEVERLDRVTRQQHQHGAALDLGHFRPAWRRTDQASVVRRAQFDSDDCFGININRVPLELKIRIPTVHVLGATDPRLPAGVQLAGLCDPYIRKVYEHDGGHAVPGADEPCRELAGLLLWCADRGKWPGQDVLSETDP